VNNLFGTIGGLGMGLFTFDWAAISDIGSPLVVPVCLVHMPITIHNTHHKMS